MNNTEAGLTRERFSLEQRISSTRVSLRQICGLLYPSSLGYAWDMAGVQKNVLTEWMDGWISGQLWVTSQFVLLLATLIEKKEKKYLTHIQEVGLQSIRKIIDAIF